VKSLACGYKQITLQQKKIIWSLWKREINQDDSLLYAMIQEQFQCDRMSALSYQQADLLIRRLRSTAAHLGPNRLTAAQLGEIHRRRREFGWSESTLREFCKHTTGVDLLEWLGVAEARNLITALEKLRRRGYGAQHGLQ